MWSGPGAVPGSRSDCSVEHRRSCFWHWPIDQHRRAVVREERFDLPPKLLIGATGLRKKRTPLSRLVLERRLIT